MVRGLYTATSGMLCQEAVTHLTANNLANVNTAGYKKDKAIFRDFPSMLLRRINDPTKKLYEHKIDPMPYVGKLGTGAIVDEVYNDKTQADLTETGNAFDLGIFGDGYFVVNTPNGPAFTRNGAFKVGAGGRLCTLEGFTLMAMRAPANAAQDQAIIGADGKLPADAMEVEIEEENRDLTVSEDGSVYIDGELKGRLLVVDFENPGRLLKRGKNLYFQNKDTGSGLFQDETKVFQGKLENSNVSAVEAMVRLITAQRSYEANQKSISSEDQALGKAVNEVGRAT